MNRYVPIQPCDYGPLDPKVDLSPDFFTGFDPARRKEIVTAEARFYRELTRPFSVDDRLTKRYASFTAPDGYEVPVKLYRPKDNGGALPVLVFLHGGGFKTCSVETHDFVPSYIAANAGVMAVSVEYRLAPEHKFPTGLEDCYQAVRWVAANAGALGADAAKIMLCGDSSGGNFVAALTLMARERKEFTVARQVLIYPVTEVTGTVYKRSAEVYAMVGVGDKSASPLAPLMAEYLADPAKEVWSPLVSPMLAEDLSGLPDALFIEAECDALADDGLIYAKLLRDAGVKVRWKVYKGMPHAFVLRTYDETFSALNEICAFVK